MHVVPTLSIVGLSLLVAGSALTSGAGMDAAPTGEIRGYSVVVPGGDFAPYPRPAARGAALQIKDSGAEEMATTRHCTTPIWGETKNACATFALTPGQSVEVVLTEVLDTSDAKQDEPIYFRLYDIAAPKEIDKFSLKVGGAKYTFTNNTDKLLDLVLHAKGQPSAGERKITFTYEKK